MPVDKFGARDTASQPRGSYFSPVGLVRRSGDTMLGTLSLGGFRLKDVGDPEDPTDAITKSYITEEVSKLKKYVDALSAEEVSKLKKYVDTLSAEEVSKLKKYVDTLSAEEVSKLKKYVDALSAEEDAKLKKYVAELSAEEVAKIKDKFVENLKALDAAIKKYVAELSAEEAAKIKDELMEDLGHRSDIYELSLRWGVSRTLSITPIGPLQLTENARNDGDRIATLALRSPGAYKFQVVGLRTGANRQPIDISLHAPAALVLQHTIPDYIHFNSTGVCVISQPSPLQVSISSVRTTTSDNINIKASLIIEKLH